MKIVLVEPGKPAQITEISSNLESMQEEVVVGYIEAMYPYSEEVAIICNEEGKINGLPLNRAIYADNGDSKEMIDIIAGSFFICACSSDNFTSLSEDQLHRYAKEFKNPEMFIRTHEGITVIPYMSKNREQER